MRPAKINTSKWPPEVDFCIVNMLSTRISLELRFVQQTVEAGNGGNN